MIGSQSVNASSERERERGTERPREPDFMLVNEGGGCATA